MDRIDSALNMPSVATYNMRSLFPKIHNLRKDILERKIQVAFLCEVWEKPGKQEHKEEIEEMVEVDGLNYI